MRSRAISIVTGGGGAHRVMPGDDTRGDVCTVAGAWEGLPCSGGAASGKFLHVSILGGGGGRTVA